MPREIDNTTLLRVDRVLAEIRQEVLRAMQKHGPIRSGHEGYAVIQEEVEELWSDVKSDRPDDALKEATQVAAMGVRFIVDLKRA
jgi:hypothetical protein